MNVSSLPSPTRAVRNAAGAAGALVTTVADTVTAVPAVAASALALVPRVEQLLGRVEDLVSRVESVVDGAEGAVTRTRDVIDGADALVQRGDGLLTSFEEPLARLLPSLKKFSETLEPHEVEAAITLIDRLPVMLGHVEDDLLPMLTTLDRVGPDIHELLEVVEDLRRVVTGLPGVSLFRRRGDDEPQQAVESTTGAQPARRRPRR